MKECTGYLIVVKQGDSSKHEFTGSSYPDLVVEALSSATEGDLVCVYEVIQDSLGEDQVTGLVTKFKVSMKEPE